MIRKEGEEFVATFLCKGSYEKENLVIKERFAIICS